MEEIRQILTQADDFGLEDDRPPQPNGSWFFPWLEPRSGIRRFLPLFGQRILANLTLTPRSLEVEAMSPRRLDACCQRLEQLLGERIRLVGTRKGSTDQALRKRKPPAESQEPVTLPPEAIAEIEDQMLRQWIDEPIPALDGLTPRQAVKTPAGRQQVLELIDEAGRKQKMLKQTPGTFAPDYRKVKKMLGLE